MSEPKHFCEIPQEALCGRYLAANNFELFYKNTTNTFACVTCVPCRNEVRRTRFEPVGFGDPEEWGN